MRLRRSLELNRRAAGHADMRAQSSSAKFRLPRGFTCIPIYRSSSNGWTRPGATASARSPQRSLRWASRARLAGSPPLHQRRATRAGPRGPPASMQSRSRSPRGRVPSLAPVRMTRAAARLGIQRAAVALSISASRSWRNASPAIARASADRRGRARRAGGRRGLFERFTASQYGIEHLERGAARVNSGRGYIATASNGLEPSAR